MVVFNFIEGALKTLRNYDDLVYEKTPKSDIPFHSYFRSKSQFCTDICSFSRLKIV